MPRYLVGPPMDEYARSRYPKKEKLPTLIFGMRARPFEPNQIAGLTAWYRLNTGITSAGGAVSVWADQSGNGNNFTQSTATNQPTITSRGSVLCDGVDNFMTATFNLPQPCTIYGLVNTITWTSGDRLLNGEGAVAGGIIRQVTSTPQVDFSAGAVGGVISPVLNTVNVITTVWNGASSLIQLNNNTPVTGNAGTREFNNPWLAATPTPSNFGHTDNYEWIFYSGAHDEGARLKIVSYLAQIGNVSL